MHTYTIKKNGYPIGQARGTHQAVKLIASDLNGISGEWKRLGGLVECKAGINSYNMEVMR